MGLRLTAAAPAIASIAATALGIALLASGSSTGTANNNYWIALNTSKIGQDLIQITPTDQSSSSSNDPLGGLGGIINDIPGLSGILDNLTNGVDQGLNDLSGTILGNLTEALGIKDTYRLYTTKMCQGSFRNEDDPNSAVEVDSCFTYRDQGQGLVNITNSIPSSLTVGTAQVSVPLIASLKQSLQSTVNLAATAATVMMVLLIIGCICTAITAIGSILGILRSQSRLLSVVNTGFSVLGAGIFLGLAGIVTGVVVAGSDSISDLGRGFNLEVKEGGAYLAIIWVSAVLAWVASAYWFMVWFVEFRRSAFSRRHRTSTQIGNWRGIIGEVRKDLKVNGHFGEHTYDGERGALKA
ncbi:hypothetical protein J7T55_009433 [Diaporthe amygdali]|uniref:uncharacterized protein n=1 Tax=Phomopsis amygdali TaxID=1214568 RepID=UPI0022FEFB7D|nr:uncharacterized protein J7T55_009433 [Diaporthe amygdali]KAJ0104269.1 hypothetical protein J7T55_009433 [Diaporthe amygdali]